MIEFEKIKAELEAAHKDTILPPMALAAGIPAETRLIILIDIVGFSKGTSREQVYKIYAFEHYVTKSLMENLVNFKKPIRIDRFIPTGDGCYIVADKCDPSQAMDFLTALIRGFQYLKTDDENPWALRASALFGECIPFLDLAHHKNFIGEGMNEAARILSYGQAALEKDFLEKNPAAGISDAKLFSRNSLYVGDSLSETLKNYAGSNEELFSFTAIPDKHGKTRDITVLQGLR